MYCSLKHCLCLVKYILSKNSAFFLSVKEKLFENSGTHYTYVSLRKNNRIRRKGSYVFVGRYVGKKRLDLFERVDLRD